MLTRSATVAFTVISVTALCLAPGCDSDSTQLLAPEPQATRTQKGGGEEVIVEPRAIPRFGVELQVSEPHLNDPIRVVVSITGGVPTSLARVVVSSPELEISRLSGGRLADVPTSVRIPAILDRSFSLDAGGRVVFERTILISTPGYYRVTATASPLGGVQRFFGAQVVQDIVPVDVWVYVDESRGEVTSYLDSKVVPDSVVAAPGPRVLKRPARAGFAPSRTPADLRSTAYSGSLRYNNNNFSPAHQDPLAHATVQGEYRDWVTDEWVRYLTTSTDASGHFTLDCVGSAYFTGYARLDNSQLRVGSGGSAYSVPVYVDDTCSGGSGSHFVGSSDGGRVWANLMTTIANSTTHFGRTRPKIPVDITTSGETYYSPTTDRINIHTSRIWQQDGFRVAAHEYGHAFHEKALGGIGWASGQCPTAGHWLDGAYSLQCAYTEGFAQFYAALVMQDSLVGFDEDLFESPHVTAGQMWGLANGFWCENSTSYSYGVCISGGAPSPLTLDGARAEAAVAAFLYDLADGPGTANSPQGSDDDAVAFGGAWIGDVINSCQVLEGSSWVRNNGVDHLIYCFEWRLGGYAQEGYFPTRSVVPSNWYSPVSSPPGWSANAVRAVWQQNLYLNGPPAPPPPPPYVVGISGPTQVRPGSTCLYQATPQNGTPPYSYAWTANGVPVGGDSPYYYHTAGDGGFDLAVMVTDAQSRVAWGLFSVSVSVWAPECLDS